MQQQSTTAAHGGVTTFEPCTQGSNSRSTTTFIYRHSQLLTSHVSDKEPQFLAEQCRLRGANEINTSAAAWLAIKISDGSLL